MYEAMITMRRSGSRKNSTGLVDMLHSARSSFLRHRRLPGRGMVSAGRALGG
jgi:hypothetical protein